VLSNASAAVSQDCTQCAAKRIYIPFPKSPYPFPSLARYAARELLNLSFSACSHCEQGVYSYYVVNADQEVPLCVPRLFSLSMLF
jgi:hypothetical protein